MLDAAPTLCGVSCALPSEVQRLEKDSVSPLSFHDLVCSPLSQDSLTRNAARGALTPCRWCNVHDD
eukprot:702785-Amphidinium_carterae.1